MQAGHAVECAPWFSVVGSERCRLVRGCARCLLLNERMSMLRLSGLLVIPSLSTDH